jgi:hypothetical protein
VVQLIVAAKEIGLTDQPAIVRGTRVQVNDAHGIVLSIAAGIQQRDIRQTLWRSLHCHAR